MMTIINRDNFKQIDIDINRKRIINSILVLPEEFTTLRVKDISPYLEKGDYISIYMLDQKVDHFRALECDRQVFDKYMFMHCYVKYITLINKLLIVHLEVQP